MELPVPSTSFTSDAVLEYPVGTTFELRYEYREDGVGYRGALRFFWVRAHRHRTEGACTSWHVKDVYDTLTEVRNSTWVDEIETATYELGNDPGELHHYMIYIDSMGCYEFVARRWESTAPERIE